MLDNGDGWEHNLGHDKLLPKNKWHGYFMSNTLQPRKLIDINLEQLICFPPEKQNVV